MKEARKMKEGSKDDDLLQLLLVAFNKTALFTVRVSVLFCLPVQVQAGTLKEGRKI
jgi:hypothetical protein